jgi:hypothetical protein
LEKGTMHACIVRFHKKKQVKQWSYMKAIQVLCPVGN